MKNWTNGGTSRIHVLAKLRRTAPLEKEVEALKTENIVLRTELQNKQGVVGRLEILVRERSNRVDQLTEIIDRLRQQNKRLDAEAEDLAEIVRNWRKPT